MTVLILSTFSILFLQGCIGIVFKRENCLLALFSIELMYLAVISSYLLYYNISENELGQVYGLLILLLAACESAVGLGILIILYNWGKSLNFNNYQSLHG